MSTVTTTRGIWSAMVDALVIAGLVMLAALAFGPAYGGQRWMVTCALGALIGSAIGLLSARRRAPWTVVALALVLAYLAFGAALAVPSTAIGGVFPGIESLRQLTVGVVTSWRQLLTVAVPVGSSGAVLIPAFITVLVSSCAGTLLAVRTRRPLWALTAPLAALIVAALFGTDASRLPVLSGTLVGVIGLAWASWRERGPDGLGLDVRRPVSAVVVLVAAVAAGFVVGPHLVTEERFALRETIETPFDPQKFPSPLVGFRKYFKDLRDADLFSISGLPDSARVRLAVLDDYDGVTFDASTASGPFVRVGERIDDPAPGEPASIVVTIHDYQGVYLPGAGHLTGMTFESDDESTLRDGFRYSSGNAVAVVTSGLQRDDRYRALVALPKDAATPDLSATPLDRVVLPSPGRVPDAIKTVAGKLTENARTPYERIVAVQKGLAGQGFLSHGAPDEEPSASGHGIDRLSRLLGDKEMVGDQEQFAPAMALMLRSMNIPARVVMGFNPAPQTGGTRIVHGSDVTAWVEVPFEGVGWVAFDPTPDTQRAAPQPDPEPQVAPRAQVLQPPPPPQPPQDANTTDFDSGNEDDPKDDVRDDQDDQLNGIIRVLMVIGLWVGIPLLVVGFPVGLILWLKSRRRKARRLAALPFDRIAGGWEQIVDTAADLGHRVPARLTRTETAADVDGHFGGSTVLLARRTDARVFGPEDVDDAEAERFWTDVEAAMLGLNAGRGRWVRWRAALSTRSLRRPRR